MGHHLDAPPTVPLDEAGVHAIEVGGEERRFVAAGAGADLDDRRAVVERVVGDEEGAQVEFDLLDRAGEAFDLRFGLGGHLGVVNGNELARLHELVLVFPKLLRQLHHGPEPLVLPTEGGQPPGVLGGRGIGKFAFDFGGARDGVRQAGAETQADLPAYFWRKRSTRPAVSTSFCFPV